ncbi:hypothetical protein HOE22_05260 [Candidatus Woesearchaeota archaeon]|jgi:phage baseplate assembly protein W|nr:hypothetical protein [Candidatus Woesearchaeota archaeon]MBT4731146.1 hypothetical protein [Candidatus Woesearchaeota archaeon]MBT5759049.1 hypothetical protein [Candidatus Neomarinimicrobiota bacterium]MBT7557381.1 hypothetical protein [Candidatus Woesearchaeota archaeon]
MGAREKDLNPDVSIGLSLPMGYSNTGHFTQTNTTLEQAKHNIVNLLKTMKGERVGQPEFGSRLNEVIFEPMDENLNDKLEEAIRESMEQWLPYVNIKKLKVELPDYGRNTVNISIDFGLSFEPGMSAQVSISFEQFESYSELAQ